MKIKMKKMTVKMKKTVKRETAMMMKMQKKKKL